MKLATTDGARLVAIVDDEQVVDITDAVTLGHVGHGGPLLAFLENGGGAAELNALDLDSLPHATLAETTLVAPSPAPARSSAPP